MSKNKEIAENSSSVKVNRAPVDSITIYEVTEGELTEIESSSPCDILFDVFIASLSIGCSFVLTLTTTHIENVRLFIAYLIVAVGCGIAAVISFVNWKIVKGRRTNVIEKIKSRKRPAPRKFGPDNNSIELDLGVKEVSTC